MTGLSAGLVAARQYFNGIQCNCPQRGQRGAFRLPDRINNSTPVGNMRAFQAGLWIESQTVNGCQVGGQFGGLRSRFKSV
jgi:hypothetical protein